MVFVGFSTPRRWNPLSALIGAPTGRKRARRVPVALENVAKVQVQALLGNQP